MMIGAQNLEAAPASAGYIDAHVHIWTPDIRRYPHDPQYTGPAYQPASFEPEELFSFTRPAGVARIVLVQMSFYGVDNSYMLNGMAKYKRTFSGIAAVNHHAAGVAEEMLRLARLGVRGFRILPGTGGTDWLNTPGMESMWRCAAGHRLALCCLIDPVFLPSIDAMCNRFPDTPVVIDHLARIGVDGSIRAADVKVLCSLARHRNVSVKVSAFYALGKKQAPYTDLGNLIRAVYEAFGARRLMWASDSPFQVLPPHTYPASLDLVRSRLDFLTEKDRDWLLTKTAQRLFFD